MEEAAVFGGIEITVEDLEELGSNFWKDIGILMNLDRIAIIKKIFWLIIY